jgi:hypothetical protein
MSVATLIGFVEERDFEVPRLCGLQIRSFIGYSESRSRDRFETAVLTFSDDSVHSVYFSALLCTWTELTVDEAKILDDDYEDTTRVDYAAIFGLAGARVHDIRCVRDDATRVQLTLDRGVIDLVEIDPQDPLSEAQISFDTRAAG